MARILVIDDERLVCDLLRNALGNQGHEILTAHSGRQGVELFRQHRPRFTVLDLQMPEMNGIEVLKEIRSINPEADVMILTAWGSDDLENRARDLGVTEFLSKSLPLEVLVSAVERVLEPRKTASSLVEKAKAADFKKKTGSPANGSGGEYAAGAFGREASRASILVVDDEPLIRNLLEQFLSLRDYRVRSAADGNTALAMVEQEEPQFVVLDMYMPGMNGVEVFRRLREKNYQGRVLGLTASQDQELLQEMRDLGSVDILGKPVDLERLALAIQIGGAFEAARKKDS